MNIAIHPRPTAPLPETLTGIWDALGALLRTITPDAEVRRSVRERGADVADYRPASLPDLGKG